MSKLVRAVLYKSKVCKDCLLAVKLNKDVQLFAYIQDKLKFVDASMHDNLGVFAMYSVRMLWLMAL